MMAEILVMGYPYWAGVAAGLLRRESDVALGNLVPRRSDCSYIWKEGRDMMQHLIRWPLWLRTRSNPTPKPPGGPQETGRLAKDRTLLIGCDYWGSVAADMLRRAGFQAVPYKVRRENLPSYSGSGVHFVRSAIGVVDPSVAQRPCTLSAGWRPNGFSAWSDLRESEWCSTG